VTATIFVQDKPWLFRVGKVEGLTSTEREQAVKEGALLEQVRFYGPDALMRRLQKANLIGKLLTIEGQLDAKGEAVPGHGSGRSQRRRTAQSLATETLGSSLGGRLGKNLEGSH